MLLRNGAKNRGHRLQRCAFNFMQMLCSHLSNSSALVKEDSSNYQWLDLAVFLVVLNKHTMYYIRLTD